MFNTFDEAMTGLLEDEGLDEAQGGQITKHDDQFNYNLHGGGDPDGELFLEINKSSTPEVTWRVIYPGGEEARTAYREFASNPENGQLLAA